MTAKRRRTESEKAVETVPAPELPSRAPNPPPEKDYRPKAHRWPVSTHLEEVRETLQTVTGRIKGLDDLLAIIDEKCEPGDEAVAVSVAVGHLLDLFVEDLNDLHKYLGRIQQLAYERETGQTGGE